MRGQGERPSRMPSRVPLTNLRDAGKGGAPLFVGGDRLDGDGALPTPPDFVDDADPYFADEYERRGLLTIGHVPPGGAATVDFVTLFLRNTSTTERAYVNVLLGSDVAVEMRVAGVQVASPAYADVLLIDADDAGTQVDAALDAATGELSVSVRASGKYDATAVAPTVEFDPPPAGNLAAYAVIDPDTKSISAITVINPTAHTYAEPPAVRVRGGTLQAIGFFEAKDADTRVAASAQSGALTVIGNLCRTEFANNISQPGDVLLVNNEVRVVQSVNAATREFFIDSGLTGTRTQFSSWSFLPLLSASASSLYRVGGGRLHAQPALGPVGMACTEPHRLCVGDTVVYTSGNGVFHSNVVASVRGAREFTVRRSVLLSASEQLTWYFVYLYSESVAASSQVNEVHVVSYVKTRDDTGGGVARVRGLGGRQLFIRNLNFFNAPGTYYDASRHADAAVVQYCTVAGAHSAHAEVPHAIDASTVLEIELKPQPSPEMQVLSGFPLNGGLATETGARPLLCVYERGARVASSRVLFWGYYMRYSPETGTSLVKAVNI